MIKKSGMSMQDLDVLGDIGGDTTEVAGGVSDVNIFDGIDFSKPSEDSEETLEAPLSTETPEASTKDTPDSNITEPAVKGEEATNDKGGEDNLDKFINDLIQSQAELEDKVQVVADAAEDSNDPELIKVVDELQTMIAEKNIEIAELKKANEVTMDKYMSKFGENSDLSLYKDEVDTLDTNPKLRALIKFRGSDNEKVRTKVDNIVMDLIYERLGVDVSELLDQKDKSTISGILNTPDSNSQMISPLPEKEEDKEMNYEKSTNDLF